MISIVGTWRLVRAEAFDANGKPQPAPYGGAPIGRVMFTSSRRMMAMELRRKGLTDEAVSSAVANVDDEALAYEAAQKKVARYKALEWNEFRKKLSDFLARRGFSYSVVAPVVTRLWNEVRKDEQHYEEEDST